MMGVDADKDSKSIAIHIQINENLPESSSSALASGSSGSSGSSGAWLMGYVAVSGKTHWDHLDASIVRLFTDYLRQVDPHCHLGLDSECLWYYRVGEIQRPVMPDGCDPSVAVAAVTAVVAAPEAAGVPELLPCGYLVGDVDHIDVFVKTPAKYALPACLSLDTLIPLPILNR